MSRRGHGGGAAANPVAVGEGQAGRISDAAAGYRGQREGGQESGRRGSGQAGARGTGRGEESGKNRHSEQGPRGIGEGHGGLQGQKQGKAGQQGAGGKVQGKAGQAGKGQGKVGGSGYMGSPVFPGKGRGGWWGAVLPPTIPPFPPPLYPAVGNLYPPPPSYPGVLPPTPVRQHPLAGGATWGAQGGNGEEVRRAWERIEEEERRLREREARAMGEVAGAAEGRATGQGSPGGGEAQAMEKLRRAWASLRRRLERVQRAERELARPREQAQGTAGPEDRPPLQPFRQPAIPPEVERGMQEIAWKRIRGEAARLAERDRKVAEREHRVREEEKAVARRAHGVIPDPEGDTPPHGCGGTVAVQEKDKRGRRRGWASAAKATPGGGAGSGGSKGGAAAHQPQPRTDADGLGLGVTTAAAVCAASGTGGDGDSPGVEVGGRGGVGPLREVGREDEKGTGEARDVPILRPGPQGGEAARPGAGDGAGQVEEDAGRGAPGGEHGGSQGTGEKAQGADAEGAVAEGGVVLRGTWAGRWRGVGQGR